MSDDAFEDEFMMDGDADTIDDLNESSGGQIRNECWCMFEIANIKDELHPEGTVQSGKNKGQPKSPSLNFTCKNMVTVPGLAKEGEVVYHRVYFSSAARPQPEETRRAAKKFGLGIGVLKAFTDGDRTIAVDATDGSKRYGPPTYQRASGWFFCGLVKVNKSGYAEFPFGEGVYMIGDPAVAHVKKNWDAIADVYGQERASQLAEAHSRWLQDNPPGSEGWLKVYPKGKDGKGGEKKPDSKSSGQGQSNSQQNQSSASQGQQTQQPESSQAVAEAESDDDILAGL